ncbi:MAG: hypothetical protein U0228_07980 [Myxococcaceae bacterium]
MKKMILLALATLLPVLSGCAGMQVKKDQVAAAHRVALVGYQGVLQLEDQNSSSKKGGITGMIGAGKAAGDLMSGKLGARRAEQGTLGYGELSKRLEKTFNWEMVPKEQLTGVPVYSDRLSKSVKLARVGSQTVDGVLTTGELASVKPQQLGELAQALNADAVATVNVTYTVGKTGGVSIGGFGSTTKYPVATAHLTVVDKQGQVIWEDYAARGQVTSQCLRNTMGADIVENETEVLTEAANSAFDAVIQRYQSFEEKK